MVPRPGLKAMNGEWMGKQKWARRRSPPNGHCELTRSPSPPGAYWPLRLRSCSSPSFLEVWSPDQQDQHSLGASSMQPRTPHLRPDDSESAFSIRPPNCSHDIFPRCVPIYIKPPPNSPDTLSSFKSKVEKLWSSHKLTSVPTRHLNWKLTNINCICSQTHVMPAFLTEFLWLF